MQVVIGTIILKLLKKAYDEHIITVRLCIPRSHDCVEKITIRTRHQVIIEISNYLRNLLFAKNKKNFVKQFCNQATFVNRVLFKNKITLCCFGLLI